MGADPRYDAAMARWCALVLAKGKVGTLGGVCVVCGRHRPDVWDSWWCGLCTPATTYRQRGRLNHEYSRARIEALYGGKP